MNNEKWNSYVNKLIYPETTTKVELRTGHRKITLNAFEKLFANAPPENRKVLVVGAADGVEVEYFLDKGFEVVGVDMSDSQFKARDNKNLNLIKCDMHEICFPNDTFDLVYCCHVYEHAVSPMIALDEMRRVLKNKGLLFISTPLSNEKWHIQDPTHIFIPIKEQLTTLAGKIGLGEEYYGITKEPGFKDEDQSQIWLFRKVLVQHAKFEDKNNKPKENVIRLITKNEPK